MRYPCSPRVEGCMTAMLVSTRGGCHAQDQRRDHHDPYRPAADSVRGAREGRDLHDRAAGDDDGPGHGSTGSRPAGQQKAAHSRFSRAPALCGQVCVQMEPVKHGRVPLPRTAPHPGSEGQCFLRRALCEPLNPHPSALSPQPSALSPEPPTLNPQPSTLSPEPQTPHAQTHPLWTPQP